MGVVFLLLSYHVHPACGLLGIFILAHEPWINHFSHIAFGLTTIPFLLTTALLLFTIAIHKGTLPPLLLATGVYCLAIYSYPPVRLFVPLFGAGLLLIYWRKILNKPGMFRNFLIAGVFFAILMGPLLYYLLQIEDFMNRFEYLGIFTTPHIGKSSGYKWLSTIFREDFLDKQSLFTRGLVAIAHYASYYSPDYLFSHADRNLRFGSSDYGVLASYDSIGLILGLITLSLRRNSFDKILLLGFILYPIPASLTWEDIPHTGRAIAGHPLVNLIVTLGFWQLLVVIWKANWPKTARCSTLFLTLLAIGYASLSHAQEYYHFHRTKFSHHSSGVMQYGFKEMMEYIEMNHKKYEQVHIVSTFLHYQPYIFALLYSDTDPAKWQAQQKLPWGIEKIFTHSLPQDQFQKNTLYMISPPLKTLPQGVALLKTYHWEDHSSEAFAFYEYTGGSETFEKDWS